MKRFTPYIFPLIVVGIVFFLVYRWYTLRTERPADSSQYGEGIQIENLSSQEANKMLVGGKDVTTSPLTLSEAAPEEMTGRGSIRYEVQDSKVVFSVTADLPKKEVPYVVWMRSPSGDDLTQAFLLTEGKGGLVGSAVVPADKLPLEVIVSTAQTKSEVLKNEIMKGMLTQPAEKK